MTMEPVAGENALERGLHVLERFNDPELVEVYKRYMDRLEALVGRDQLDTYAVLYQRDRRQLNQQVVASGLSDEAQAVWDKVAGDQEVHRLYEQYIRLATAHGIVDPRFNLDSPTGP